MPIICPNCEKDDAIQKISAVVVGGQSSGTFYGPTAGVAYAGGKLGFAGGYTTLYGRNVSEIAKLLAAPIEPKAPPEGRGSTIIGIGVLLGFLALICNDDISDLGYLLGFFAVVIFAVGIWLMFDARKKREFANRQKPLWNTAMRIWDGLYYC
jgi:hypothetical protein